MQNEKEQYFVLIFLAGTVIGTLCELVFYNYPLIQELHMQARLSFLMNVFKHPAFWLHNGIYFRASMIVAITVLIWITGGRYEPEKPATPYYISATLGALAVLTCHLLLRHNLEPVLYIAGNFMLIAGTASFVAGAAGIRRVIGFGIKPDHEFKLKGQNTKLIVTDNSINWKTADGYVNITNPFRGICIVGGPGAGKSYTLIEPIIDQTIEKGFTGMIYDFKFPTLGRYAYNMMLKHDDKVFYFDKARTQPKPKRQFYCINFKDIRYSHRCNPIHPKIMDNKTKSDEVAMTVMLNLEKDWIKKRDFFANSAISYFSAILWYLRKYAVKKKLDVCTLPHAIILALTDPEKILTILSQDPEAMIGATPLMEAFNKGAMEQLAGQIASLQIPIGKLAIKEMFWVMTGNDFTLDLNNPQEPKVVVIGNDDQLKKVFAPALSLYASVIAATINQKGKENSFFTVDEFPTIFIPGIDNLPNTGRSNKVCFCIAMQDYGQLDRDYGKEEARVLAAGCGNVFIGEVSDQSTAKVASEMMGKEWQQKQTLTISKSDTTQNLSTSFNEIIPINRIMQLKTGEFVGKVAEVDEERKELDNSKLFASQFMVDKKGDPSADIPKIFDVFASTGTDHDGKTEEEMIKIVIDQNYTQIQIDIEQLVFEEFEMAKLKSIMKRSDDYRDAYKYINSKNQFDELFSDVNTTFKRLILEAETEYLANKRAGTREKESMDEKIDRVTKEYITSCLESFFNKQD